MRIDLKSPLSFRRRLLSNEEEEFSTVLKQGKEKIGNTGNSILIVPSSSLPQQVNTGVGNFLDKEGLNFIDFAKLYWGINHIQLLPEGHFKMVNKKVLPYSGSALSLGTQLINIELLTTEDYAKLLNASDLAQVTENEKNNLANVVNYENVIRKNSPVEKVLLKAYDELLKADTDRKKTLLKELEEYTQTNKDWLEPKAVFEALSKKYENNYYSYWNDFDRNFYNSDIISIQERDNAIKGLRDSEFGKDMRFFEFKQFLAEKHLSKAKEELNKKGIKVSGDLLIGFSNDEVWANPKAFIENTSIKWGLPALNYDSQESRKLLSNKIRNFAKRYDGIRIDAAWIYSSQPLKNEVTSKVFKKNYNDEILNFIEQEIKHIKGKDFDMENITYEFIADKEDFSMFEGCSLKSFVKNKNKIFCTTDLNQDWCTVQNFRKRYWKDGTYTIGPTNHDSEPIREIFMNPSKKEKQIFALSESLKIPREKLLDLNEFIKAKFAEPMRSKHFMFFFTDALNLHGRYKDNLTKSDDYRIKIPKNYQDEYFKSLEKGEGFNIMDALEKAFVAEGLDKKEPKLFRKIVKFKKIIEEPENAVKNKSKKWILIASAISVCIVAGIGFIFKTSNKKPEDSGSNAQ